MDYHLEANVSREAPSTTSTLRIAVAALGIGAASLSLAVFPYYNCAITRKGLPTSVSWSGNQGNTVAVSDGSQFDALYTAQPATDRSERDLWESYLISITEPIGFFSVEQVENLKRVWVQACEQMGACPVPVTQAGDEGVLQFAWDNGEKYIDLEATREGGFYWYYRDRGTNEVAGTSDQAIAQIDPDFFGKLSDVIRSKPLNSPA